MSTPNSTKKAAPAVEIKDLKPTKTVKGGIVAKQTKVTLPAVGGSTHASGTVMCPW